MINDLLLSQIEKKIGSLENIPQNVLPLLYEISKTYDRHLNTLSSYTEESASAKANEPAYDQSAINEEPQISKLQELLKQEIQRRQRAEKECLQRDAHLRASQRIANVGSWELELSDLDNLYQNKLHWSEETFKIMGYIPYSVVPSNEVFFERVHPDDRNLIKETVERAIAKGSIYNVEHRVVLPNGTEKIVHERSEIIYDIGTGKPYKMIGTVQDITGRKKVEERLRNMNQELKTLAENMQEVFFSLDIERQELLHISAACEKIYGYTREEFAANNNLWLEVIVDEDRDEIAKAHSVLENGQFLQREYRIRRKDGRLAWVESKIEPILKKGKLVRLFGIVSDITDRKLAENALKESEHKFRTMIEHSTDVIVILDEYFRISYSSDTVFKVTGYLPEEILGKKCLEFVYEEDVPKYETCMNEVLEASGGPKHCIYRILRKDGHTAWTEHVAVNLLNDPAINGIILNFRDVNERIESEHALQNSNEELKKINTELDKFVYSVSHDLRAPLASVLGVIDITESETQDANVLDNLSLMKESIIKLDVFIQDILDYSRNSRQEINNEKLNFGQLLKEVSENLKYIGGTGRIDLQLSVSGDCDFYNDRVRINIILNNLISNAIRYSNTNTAAPYVNVSVKVNEDCATIIVRDNGIGIKPENMERVFDMFFREAKNSAGSGLGLYIVRETIKKLQGEIYLSSEIGTGTEFRISLPNNTTEHDSRKGKKTTACTGN